jgi:hypothetical protein
MLERTFLYYCERCPNVDLINRSAKIEGNTATNRNSLYNPVENYYKCCPFLLTYIDTFQNSVRVCVCMCVCVFVCVFVSVLIQPEGYFIQKFCIVSETLFILEQLRFCVGGAYKKTE